MEADIASGAALQEFVVLAKSAKGKAAKGVVEQAIGHPNVFVFGELLDQPSVQELQKLEPATFKLLEIFAYGTYQDYIREQQKLPALTPTQATKLRKLTIVSLSCNQKSIPYSLLQKELAITDVRVLEDIIIESIYQEIIQGKLDQRSKCLEIDWTMGRDVASNQIEQLLETLSSWNDNAQALLKTIESKVSQAARAAEQNRIHQEQFSKKVEELQTNVKAAMDAEIRDDGLLDSHLGRSRRRKKGIIGMDRLISRLPK